MASKAQQLEPEFFGLDESARICDLTSAQFKEWVAAGLLETHESLKHDQRVCRAFDLISTLCQLGRALPVELQDYRRRVLVADDDCEMASAISRLLRQHGFIVQAVPDGFQAGSLLESFSPFVLILDMGMPNMQGMEVLTYLRSNDRYAHIRVIVVTGAPRAILTLAEEAGADLAMEKPFDNEVLLANVIRYSGIETEETA